MKKLYNYITPDGVQRKARFKDLPPTAQAVHAYEERKRIIKYRKTRRAREKLALTLRSPKPGV